MKINTMMQTASQKPAAQGKTPDNAAIFKGLISSLMTEGDSENMKPAKTVPSDPLLALIDMITSKNGAENDPDRLQPEMLQSARAAELLALLPERARLEIEQLFGSGIKVDELLSELKKTGDPAVMISAVIFAAVKAPAQTDPVIEGKNGTYEVRQMLKHFKGDSSGLSDRSVGGQVSKEQAVKLLELAVSAGMSKNSIPLQQKTGKFEQLPVRFSLSEPFISGSIKEPMETMKAQTGTHPFHVQGNTMHALQQYSIHLGESGQTEAARHQFLREFQQILAQAAIKHDGTGTTRLSVKLFPENLGAVTVELLNEKGMLTAKIAAATSGAKDLLESQIHQLRQLLVNQNIPIDKLEVSTQQQAFRSMMDQGGQRGQEQDAQPFVHNHEQDGHENEDEEEPQTFQEMLLNLKI